MGSNLDLVAAQCEGWYSLSDTAYRPPPILEIQSVFDSGLTKVSDLNLTILAQSSK